MRPLKQSGQIAAISKYIATATGPMLVLIGLCVWFGH